MKHDVMCRHPFRIAFDLITSMSFSPLALSLYIVCAVERVVFNTNQHLQWWMQRLVF